ncbi:MAG: DUF3037 domain-containing protein [Bacteroidota bacterium]|nr:DUF3037 domain-containing protein [Bacteroidota bacterium]
MQKKDLFEYAVIRIVPRVEREEFLNAGVVLYCAKQKFLKVLYTIDEEKLATLCDDCDIPSVKKYLNAFEKVSKGNNNSGPIGKLSMAERFRWLTATRSTMVQTSKVHPGFCEDANETLEKLFNKLVK